MKKNKFLNCNFEIKNIDDEDGIIEGYASTFGNIDLGLDIVDKGAFKKSIQETGGKVPILADHDPRKQIGFNLEAKEDDTGLFVRGQLDVKENQLARERFSLAKKAIEIGAKSGLSIGFMTIKEEPDRDKPAVRHLKEVKLMEFSFVTFPMNTEAMVTDAKHFMSTDINSIIGDFVATLKSRGYNEKEIFQALETAAYPEGNPSEIAQLISECNEALK